MPPGPPPAAKSAIERAERELQAELAARGETITQKLTREAAEERQRKADEAALRQAIADAKPKPGGGGGLFGRFRRTPRV